MLQAPRGSPPAAVPQRHGAGRGGPGPPIWGHDAGASPGGHGVTQFPPCRARDGSGPGGGTAACPGAVTPAGDGDVFGAVAVPREAAARPLLAPNPAGCPQGGGPEGGHGPQSRCPGGSGGQGPARGGGGGGAGRCCPCAAPGDSGVTPITAVRDGAGGGVGHCGVVALPAVSSRRPCHGDTPGRGPQVGTSAAWGPAVTFRGDPHAARREARRGAAPPAAPALPAPRTCTHRGGPVGCHCPPWGSPGWQEGRVPRQGTGTPSTPRSSRMGPLSSGLQRAEPCPQMPWVGMGRGLRSGCPPPSSPQIPSALQPGLQHPAPPQCTPSTLGCRQGWLCSPPSHRGTVGAPGGAPPTHQSRVGSLRKPRSQPPHLPTPRFDLCRSWWKK